MIDYCTQQDVEDNLKGVKVDTSTAITESILADMISQESAVIDQHVGRKYELPVTDTTSLLFLKKICIDLVVYRVTKVLQPQKVQRLPGQDKIQEISEASAYRAAMVMLKEILNGKTILPGEDERTFNFFSSTAVDDDHQTTFELEEQQW